MNNKKEILKVCKRCLPNVDFENNNRLIESGLIDSLSFMKLVSELSFNFNIFFDAMDLTPDNFQSIDAIVKIVERLRGETR